MNVEEITAEIARLEERLEKVVSLDRVEKNRQGIELHQKIKRLKNELDRMDPPASAELKARLHTLVNRQLTEVFELDEHEADAEHIYYSVRISFASDAPISATRAVKETIINAFADNPHIVGVTVKQSSK